MKDYADVWILKLERNIIELETHQLVNNYTLIQMGVHIILLLIYIMILSSNLAGYVYCRMLHLASNLLLSSIC
jgi:hypothetical protein